MRIALRSAPDAVSGAFQWRTIASGFEVADLPVIADGQVVDRILLARIDPNHYRFIVRNASDGDKGLDQWMTDLGAALVVNGSYFARDGRPDTPFLSDGVLLGPRAYDAKAGAFVVTRTSVGVVDLATTDWRAAFNGADSAMVSYPMLVAGDSSRVSPASRWLANRSFVGQDGQGRIIIGTTADGFFSLERFARFLHEAPLGLTFALNLDGGPVASQAICLNGFNRRSYGRWEAQVNNNQVQLLTWPYGTVAMPVVLAVLPE
jgi:exopolysaccharide biosynthesis protein